MADRGIPLGIHIKRLMTHIAESINIRRVNTQVLTIILWVWSRETSMGISERKWI